MSHGHSHENQGHAHSQHALTKPLLDVEHGHECQGHAHGGKGHDDHGQRGDAHGHGHSHEHGNAGDGHGHSCHGHGHGGHDEDQEDKQKMKKAIYFALFFMMVEIVGGIVANSLAIITDAAHMLSDVGGFIVSLLALEIASADGTDDFTFGFKQAEVLGALFSIMLVWALTAVLLYQAVFRFITPEEVHAPTMLVIAVVGFVVNLVLMKVLGHGHSHGGDGHGHSHGGHAEEDNAAIQAALAHVIGDIVQSLGVCLAAALMWWQPFDIGTTANGISNWNFADPCCTLLFGVIVLFTTKDTLVRTVGTLMGRAPANVDQAKFVQALQKLPHVDSVHDFHVWMLGSKEVLCTAHIMISGAQNATSVLNGCINTAKAHGVGHSTFQIEVAGEFDSSTETYGNLRCNTTSSLKQEKEDTGHGQSEHAGHGHGGHGHDGGGHSHDGGGVCTGHAH